MTGFFKNARLRIANNLIRGYTEDVVAERFSALAGVSSSGISVSGETALTFSAVWAAIRILSEMPASLPKHVTEKSTDGTKRILHNDPIAELLHYPNEFQSGFDFHELMNGLLQLHGNAVGVLRRDRNGIARECLPAAWSGVNPYITNSRLMYRVDDPLFGIHDNFFSGDIIHYKLFPNGLIGRSPIKMAKDNIGLALSAERYGSEFFRKGGNHKAVIEPEVGFKSNTEYAAWREKYDKEHAGAGSDHGVPILQPGMKYHQLTMSNEDAQFILTRQFGLNDVSRWFNIPPHLIGDLSRATFSNIEHQDLQFIKYSLHGLIKRQEEEWEFKLIAPSRRETIDIRFDIDGFARGDMNARSNYATRMVNGGIITPDEGRAIDGRGPIAGGDTLRVPANIVGSKPSTDTNTEQNDNID